MADQFFQMKQRNAANTDWDNLFPARKFETAGGTATAITLTIQDLIDGVSKTFVASASNNAVATTINGKNLYKPNTTTAPTLIAGKAYTVWYSASNDCFFIKASATGTVTPDKVLAGETYSTEDDTDLVGAMDLQAGNIREGITYGGITGNLEGRNDLMPILANNTVSSSTSAIYYLISSIFSNDIWACRLIGTNLTIYQLDENYTILKQFVIDTTLDYITNIYSLFKVGNYIFYNHLSTDDMKIFDLNGNLIKTLDLNANFYDEINNRIISKSGTSNLVVHDFDGNILLNVTGGTTDLSPFFIAYNNLIFIFCDAIIYILYPDNSVKYSKLTIKQFRHYF